jgi:predicted membrane-bound spermidine synthase
MAVSKKQTFLFFTPISFPESVTRLVLSILFFFSGTAALIYQVMWQRMLFTLFGVDLESITIIVSVFMFGLGIGGILGGLVADRLRSQLLLLYIIIEVGIGVFGFFSPHILQEFSLLAMNQSEWVTALLSFLMLAFPTIFMGATFPILVTHVNQFDHNIGRSVGSLYFANTLGAALGAYFSGFVFLYSMDLYAAIDRAAMINVLVAIVAWIFFRRRR